MIEPNPTAFSCRRRSGAATESVSFRLQARLTRILILRHAEILKSWGLNVDFGEHAFCKQDYLAGTDEERLADFNAALRDPEVRAIFATRGGKGSYRIADRLDFAAVRRDPKFLIGFSDITMLHLSLWKHCRQVGIHGALFVNEGEQDVSVETEQFLRQALMTSEDIVIRSRHEEPTSALTTEGAATGRLIGGNLDMVATAAGWALPDLARRHPVAWKPSTCIAGRWTGS